MSNPHVLPNYKERYFEKKELDRIHGKPTLDSLVTMFRQLKRNAQSVPTTLGGGKHGYLALLLPTSEYDAIEGTTPFHPPIDPGIFTPVGTSTRATSPPRAIRTRARSASASRTTTPSTMTPPTPAEIAIQKSLYDERLRKFLEVQALTTIFRNQIIDSIEPDYIQALRGTTDTVTMTIPQIFTYLVNVYGKLNPEQVMNREDAVKNFIYDPLLPIDVVFNKIEFFADLCTFLKKPLPDQRKVDLAYIILNKSRVFQNSLKDWNSRPDHMKTFNEFKIFMRDEHAALDQVSGLTVEDHSTNQTTMLAHINEHQDHLATQLEERLKLNLIEALDAYSKQDDIPSTPTSVTTPDTSTLSDIKTLISNVSSKTPDAAVLSLLKEISSKLDRLGTCTPSNTSPPPTAKKNKDINPRTKKPWRRYCWSCGVCPHWGSNCPHRKPGHKPDATFSNRMGGSTVGVLGL